MSDRYQDGQACPFPHHARGAEHLHGDLLEGEHRRPRLRHDRQEEADTLPQGIEALKHAFNFESGTSWPYFGVKLRKKIAYSYLKVT